MKILNGTDIVEVSRIKENIEKHGERFLKRVYTENEIKYCESKKEHKYESYAARFAAKEATYKAVSSKIGKDYLWTDFEIVNEPTGKPKVNLYINVENLKNIEVSISHVKEYATANVIAIFEEN